MNADTPQSLREAREATIDALCQGFADESISMSELERRLESARSARTREELGRLLGDVAGANVPMKTRGRSAGERTEAVTERPRKTPERESARSSSHLAVAILGGTRRAGRWAPPAEMVAVALMGGVELDFRDAVLAEGVTEINCFAFWGGVEITVPPTVNVDTRGFALMGGFDQDAALETAPGSDAPTIRVNGFALMGGVEIKVAEPGSGRDRT